jgi:OOP family OmpA-OmpF porin
VVGTFLTKYPDTTAVIEGHTDNVGTAENNMKLSRRRAESVVNYMLDEFGIARSRLSAVGFGQTRRFAYNTSEEGQKENRRVNIIFNYPN